MNIAVLGSGEVGRTIGSKLVQLGHEVMMGSWEEANPEAVAWAKREERNALFGTFANTDHDGSRCGEAKSARASDDQNRDCSQQSLYQ